MEEQLKLKLHMVLSHAITGFTKKEEKQVQIALPQSLLGRVALLIGNKKIT